METQLSSRQTTLTNGIVLNIHCSPRWSEREPELQVPSVHAGSPTHTPPSKLETGDPSGDLWRVTLTRPRRNSKHKHTKRRVCVHTNTSCFSCFSSGNLAKIVGIKFLSDFVEVVLTSLSSNRLVVRSGGARQQAGGRGRGLARGTGPRLGR